MARLDDPAAHRQRTRSGWRTCTAAWAISGAPVTAPCAPSTPRPRAGDRATLGKAHGLLALEGHWSGTPKDGIAHGEEGRRRFSRTRSDQRWWLAMAHFYLAINHLLIGEFDERTGRRGARARDRQRHRRSAAANLRRLHDRMDRSLARQRRGRGVRACRAAWSWRRIASAAPTPRCFSPSRCSRQASTRKRCDALATDDAWSSRASRFPQWHSLAAVLLGEAERRHGRLDEASASIARGIEIAAAANYRYAVAVGERIASHVKRDRGHDDRAAAALERAVTVFDSIGAAFEADRTRAEMTG